MKKALIAALVFLASCKSTDSINRFAKSAATGTAEIGRSSLSFNNICRLYDPAALAKYTDTSLYAAYKQPPIHCSEYKKADSLTNLINETLVSYFSLLQSVSDKKLLAYNAGDLVNSLAAIQPQVLPTISMTDEKISAIKGLLNTVLSEPLKWYRYKKLVSTMQQNDSILARVISAYTFILDTALNGETSQAKENYTSFVYAPLYEWAKSPVEKTIINQQYRQFVNSMDLEKEKISKSVRLLSILQKDHHLLSFGKPPAGFAYTESEISQDIVLINKMITELIQLIK
jgi:hypothetical protein